MIHVGYVSYITYMCKWPLKALKQRPLARGGLTASTPRALYARLRRYLQRCGTRWPPARACGGRYGPLEPPVARPSRLDSAPSAHVGGTVASLRPAPVQRTARGESKATRARRPRHGQHVGIRKSSQVSASMHSSCAVALRAPRASSSGARGADADADDGGGGDASGKAGRRADVVCGALEHRNGT